MVFKKDGSNIINFENDIKSFFGNLAYATYLKDFEFEVQVHKKNLLATVVSLRYCSLYLFRQLIDLTLVDSVKKKNRFILFYQLLSDSFVMRGRLVSQTNDLITSLIGIYPNACWAEREAWDMFGVFFNCNYDLRRILTDYGFEDFPLQKTFKLTGTYELSYNDSVKRVIYQHVTETQKFREFHFSNPWSQPLIQED